MVDVCQNCFLCIAATGATSSNHGLFAQQDPLIFKACQMTKRPKDPIDSLCNPVGRHEGIFTDIPMMLPFAREDGPHKDESCRHGLDLNSGSVLVWKRREHHPQDPESKGRIFKGGFVHP